jgi:hypothetical protein
MRADGFVGPSALLCDSVRAAAGAVPVLGIARPAMCRFAGLVSTVLSSVIVSPYQPLRKSDKSQRIGARAGYKVAAF